MIKSNWETGQVLRGYASRAHRTSTVIGVQLLQEGCRRFAGDLSRLEMKRGSSLAFYAGVSLRCQRDVQ